MLSFVSLITARKRSLGQGNIFAPVCHSVHRGEYLGRYPPGQVHPLAGTPPWAGTPPLAGTPTPLAGTPPGSRYPPQQCMLGCGQQVGGTHPTGMHSCYVDELAQLS